MSNWRIVLLVALAISKVIIEFLRETNDDEQ